MIALMFRHKTILLSLWALLAATSLQLISAPASQAASQGVKEKQAAYKIHSVKWEQTADDFLLRVKGASSPTYTMYELFDPLRVVIDIADATLGESVKLPLDLPRGPVSLVNGQVLEDKEPYITRFEIFLNADNTYTVEREDNDIIVKFSKETGSAVAKPAAGSPVEPAKKSQATLKNQATEIYSIDIDKQADGTLIYLKANGPIKNFKKQKLARNVEANRPERLYIDINDIAMKKGIPSQKVGTSVAQVRAARRNNGIRVVFDSSGENLFDYELIPQPDGLLMKVSEGGKAESIIANLIDDEQQGSKSEDAIAQVINEANAEEIMPTSEPVESPVVSNYVAPEPEGMAKENKSVSPKAATNDEPQDDFAFAGYKKQRISIDFYKIDLHNVFRLIGEISNLNIVVSEEVNGSLTLALTDVPWDFALDIVLNLKDLQKEERFNTIVISQKSKNFTWPERTLDKIDFKEDLKIKTDAPDSLSIKAVQQVPETVVQAKKLIHQAYLLEKAGNFKDALPLYEEALKKWPENDQLANQISALCLVRLQMNAKAIHYAKTALKLNPEAYDAALHAAIGLARMKKNDEALSYFDLATSGPEPSSEALSSYASYNEENSRYDSALSLLTKHEEMYGDSLQSMISKARIYDKQGSSNKAVDEYRAIMLSGYEIPADLKRYIKGRITLATN